MAKKKLPTGPIKICSPVSRMHELTKPESANLETTSQESNLPESSIQETKNQKSNIPESGYQATSNLDSTNVETISQESSLQDSGIQESSIQESSIQETKNQKSNIPESGYQAASNLDSTNVETISQESSLQESSIQDFTKIEYKKISMRLSTNAASKLREFRTETGIPYEILVDVLVRNWENLPNRTKNAYLNEAKGIRSKRLIAGQQKTMATMQSKYQVD